MHVIRYEGDGWRVSGVEGVYGGVCVVVLVVVKGDRGGSSRRRRMGCVVVAMSSVALPLYASNLSPGNALLDWMLGEWWLRGSKGGRRRNGGKE